MCGFISELSILFRWSIFLFLYQHHTVSVTVALYSSLRSRSRIPPALLFFLKIALAMHSLFCFHINFKNFLPVLNVKKQDGLSVQHGYLPLWLRARLGAVMCCWCPASRQSILPCITSLGQSLFLDADINPLDMSIKTPFQMKNSIILPDKKWS